MRGRTLKRHKQHNNHVHHVVHADSHTTNQQHTDPLSAVAAPKNKPADTYQKKLLAVLTIIFIVVTIITMLRLNVRSGLQQNPDTAQTGANTQLISQSLSQLATENPTGLGSTVDQINATDAANSDPTLLYIKLRYYLAVSDTANARKTYNKLESAYDQSVGYDPLINQSARSLSGLKADVEFLEQQAQQISKNAWGTTE